MSPICYTFMMVPSTAQEKNGVTGWDRLGNFVRYMLAPHDPDDPVGDTTMSKN